MDPILFIAGIILFIMAFMWLSALLAFYWAFQQGQLTGWEQGSRVIFDEGEPEGFFTDTFPRCKRGEGGRV